MTEAISALVQLKVLQKWSRAEMTSVMNTRECRRLSSTLGLRVIKVYEP